MGNIHMGYLGSADIDGTIVKITGSSLNPVQSVEVQDLIQGSEDPIAWVYGKIETGGNITGPLAEQSAEVFDDATKRGTGNNRDRMLSDNLTIKIAYYSGGGRTFNSCQINSYQISVTAGDIAQFTIDFFGLDVDPLETGPIAGADACEKLITWDVCSVNTGQSTLDDQVQSYTYTIDNQLQRIYKIETGDSDLFPASILAGIRRISGTVSYYAELPIDTSFRTVNQGGKYGADNWGAYEADTAATNVTFNAGPDITATGQIAWHRAESAAQTGPAIYTVNFTGVCTQSF